MPGQPSSLSGETSRRTRPDGGLPRGFRKETRLLHWPREFYETEIICPEPEAPSREHEFFLAGASAPESGLRSLTLLWAKPHFADLFN